MVRALVIGLGMAVALLLGWLAWSPPAGQAPGAELALIRAPSRIEEQVLNRSNLGGGRAVAGATEVGSGQDSASNTVFCGDATGSGPARVHGTITLEPRGAQILGTPLVGCEVLGFDGEAVAARGVTDGAGRYALELPAGEWFVGSAPPGEVAWCERLSLRAGESLQLDHAHPSPVELCVRVRTLESGRLTPVAGARVHLVETDPDRGAGVELDLGLGTHGIPTDLDGLARARTSHSGGCVVLVRADGFLPASVEADFSPWLSSSPTSSDGCLDVFLELRGGPLSGRVLDASGEPLAGAVVFVDRRREIDLKTLSRSDGQGQWIRLHDSSWPKLECTGADGEFQLLRQREEISAAGAPENELELVVFPRRPELPHHFTRALDPREQWVEVRLPPSRVYTLRLQNEEGRRLNGLASVRDAGGRAHFPPGEGGSLEYRQRGVQRIFSVAEGALSFPHFGGPILVGLSPNGAWLPGEAEVVLPAPGAAHAAEPIEVTLP